MRFLGDNKQGRIARLCIIVTSTSALAACGVVAGNAPAPGLVSATVAGNGPQSDYPLTIGDPYLVDGTTYRPADVLNYDEVGYLAAGTGAGYTGSHHTLPFPAYVEVTSLETGKTILVRLEGRGPMDSNHLLALSPAAMAQIEATPDTPVRVRRVNAPETHRTLLRAGQAAPVRMDTPMGLVEVLRRRLPTEGSASLHAAAVTPELPVLVSVAADPPSFEVLAPVAAVEPEAVEPQAADPAPENFEQAFALEAIAPSIVVPTATHLADGFEVQAATFSTQERADRAAAALGGHVEPSGNFFRVRTGPYGTRGEAEASLANVRAAGYSDARILTSG